jgi:hypothetical protein
VELYLHLHYISLWCGTWTKRHVFEKLPTHAHVCIHWKFAICQRGRRGRLESEVEEDMEEDGGSKEERIMIKRKGGERRKKETGGGKRELGNVTL